MMLKRLLYACRKLADFFRIVALTGAGGLYVVAQALGHDIQVAAVIGGATFFALTLAAFVLDLITGDKE